jgi:predicted nicotinamide N-methyase
VEVSGRAYRLIHPSVADDLIDEGEFDRDERLPYWAEIWPSAIALARRLSREDLAGRRVVELGVGVGLPTLVALERGANVLATDYYAAALDFTRHNARQNGLREPETALLDWHDGPGVGAFGLVIAADVMYEERSTRSLTRLLPGLLETGGEALFADPGRRYEPLFRELMQENGFRFETEETTVEVGGLDRDVTVLVHRIRRR